MRHASDYKISSDLTEPVFMSTMTSPQFHACAYWATWRGVAVCDPAGAHITAHIRLVSERASVTGADGSH